MGIGPFQTGELLLIFVVILILLGPKKLPELARAFGQAINEFRKAAQGTTEPAREAVQAAKKSVESPVVEVIEEGKRKA